MSKNREKDLKIVQEFLALMDDKQRYAKVKQLLVKNKKEEKSVKDVNININIQGGK